MQNEHQPWEVTIRRVRIAELAAETGLSRATIDRALNRRPGVHPRTKAVVEATLEQLSSQRSAAGAARTDVDIVLRLGRGLMSQFSLISARAGRDGLRLFDMWQENEASVQELVRTLCADTARPLVITAKNTDGLIGELSRARSRGKRVIALISDLSPDARDTYVGIDNRAAGQTAAYLVGRVIGDRPAGVAVLLGDHAFRCHDDREIGFRTALRSAFPRIAMVGEAMGEDNVEKTQRAVVELLKSNPGLSAIYNVAGANVGLARALEIQDRAKDICVVGHEANAVTAPMLKSGMLSFALAARPQLLFEAAVDNALDPMATGAILDFSVYTLFNLPSWVGGTGHAEPAAGGASTGITIQSPPERRRSALNRRSIPAGDEDRLTGHEAAGIGCQVYRRADNLIRSSLAAHPIETAHIFIPGHGVSLPAVEIAVGVDQSRGDCVQQNALSGVCARLTLYQIVLRRLCCGID